MYERIECLVVGTEVAAEAEVDTGQHAVYGVGAQVLAAVVDDPFIILHKEPHYRLSKELAYCEDYSTEADTYHNAVNQYPGCPSVLSCPCILGRDSRNLIIMK